MLKGSVLPSFWERLALPASLAVRERSISVAEFERAVLQDVERLLNERVSASPDLPKRLERTILGYGLRELTGFDLSSASGAATLALAIQEAIRQFEPRLTNVVVTASDDAGSQTFRIRADLYIEPVVQRLQFQAILKSEISQLEVTGLDHLIPHAA